MKNLLVAAIAALAMFASAPAQASFDNCLQWMSLNVNSGNTSGYCIDDNGLPGSAALCTPSSQACATAYVTYSSCTGGTWDIGPTASGKKCCIKSCSRDGEQPEAVTKVESTSAQDSGLQEVFEDSRSNSYFGFVNSANRSPNAGRAQDSVARLDACLGQGAVDTLTGDSYSQWQSCRSSCANASNGGVTNYCNANSSQVCNDRCDCRYVSDSGSCVGY